MKRAIDTVVGIATVLVAVSATCACGSSNGDGRTVDNPAPVTSEPPPDNTNQPPVNPNQPPVNPNQPPVNPNQPPEPPNGGATIQPSGPVDCVTTCTNLVECSANCIQSCNELSALAGSCAAEVSAFVSCILNVGLICDGDEANPRTNDCNDPRRALNDCVQGIDRGPRN